MLICNVFCDTPDCDVGLSIDLDSREGSYGDIIDDLKSQGWFSWSWVTVPGNTDGLALNVPSYQT